MGEYANMHASEMFEQHLSDTIDYFEGLRFSLSEEHDKSAIPLNHIPYIDIKKITDKAVLVKLAITVSPFNDKFFPVDYMWIPLKWVNISTETKSIRITRWLLERKIDEQKGIIAEREYRQK